MGKKSENFRDDIIRISHFKDKETKIWKDLLVYSRSWEVNYKAVVRVF